MCIYVCIYIHTHRSKIYKYNNIVIETGNRSTLFLRLVYSKSVKYLKAESGKLMNYVLNRTTTTKTKAMWSSYYIHIGYKNELPGVSV
jgi:hypothetical protein